jgi:hypothetical protein
VLTEYASSRGRGPCPNCAVRTSLPSSIATSRNGPSQRPAWSAQYARTERPAKQQDTLQQQVAIAERHPGLRACLTDSVIFLAGGDRVLPMPNLSTITVEQADALVAQLQ